MRAYGGDPAKLPVAQDDYAVYLVAAQTLAKGKKVKVIVRDEWVNTDKIAGFGVPEGLFRFAWAGVNTTLYDGEFGKYFFLSLKVVSDFMGRPTLYDGVTVTEPTSYGLIEGMDGNPTYELSPKTGNWTANAVRMHRLVNAFAPDVVREEFTDPSNILPELENAARKVNRIAVAQRKANTKGKVRTDLGSLQYVEDAGVQVPQQKTNSTTSAVVSASVIYGFLQSAISEGVTKDLGKDVGAKVWGEGGRLSGEDAVRQWVKRLLGNAKRELGGLSISKIDDMPNLTDDEVVKILLLGDFDELAREAQQRLSVSEL